MTKSLKLYELFRTVFNLPEDKAKEAANVFDEIQADTGNFATKEDLYKVKDELKDYFHTRLWAMFVVLAAMIIGLYFK